MAKTREIKGRIKAVANIRRITKTMQMIATARFQASQRRAVSAQPYTRKISELVGELAAAAGNVEHPLLKKPDPATGRELVLVITSNRGLCGGYNANTLRVVNAYYRHQKEQGTDVQLEMVGKKGLGYCKFNQLPLAAYHTQFGDNAAYEEVDRLADRFMAEFVEGRYDAVKVIYMAFKSMSRQTPEVLTLLPLDNPATDAASDQAAVSEPSVDYDFSPAPQELLDELLPVTVKTQLFQCFNEAVVSEHIARMVAMKAATDAAGKMGRDLKRKFNRARQTAITTELSEIIAGAAALG